MLASSVIAIQYPVTEDLLFSIGLGRDTNYTIVHKFGHNTEVGSAMEDVWSLGNTMTFATTGFTLVAVSTDADDTYGGTGAWKTMILGLGTDWVDLQQEVEMNGTSESLATTLEYIRVYHSYVSEAGTYTTTRNGGNEGVITLQKAGADGHAQIPYEHSVGQGQTQMARYTIAATQTGYLLSATIQVALGANKTADVFFWQRQNADQITAPFTSRRIVVDFPDVSGEVIFKPHTPIGPFPSKTDLWWSAVRSGSQNSAVTVDFELLIIND